MVTGQDIVRVAEEVRAANLVYRQPNGYVSVQQQAPYSGDNDRFGTMWVEHCGIGSAFVLHRAGLRFGVDYPDGIQYSPLLARQILTEGYDQTPQPGAIGVIDWTAAGYGINFAHLSDHVVLIMKVEGDFFVTWECNTTPDGRAYYYRRHRSLFTAIGMPRLPDVESHSDRLSVAKMAGFIATGGR